MSTRKHIIKSYGHNHSNISNLIIPAISKGKRRLAEGDDNEPRRAKRMNFGRTTGDAEAPVAHQWYTEDTQDDDTQTWSSSVLTRTPVPLSIKVPKSAIHSVPYLASGAPISSNEAHISPQHEWYREYHSPSIPSSMSDWSFSPPSYSYSHDPLPRPTGVTRNILRASSSDDVQWHRESRQNSTAGYDNYSIRNNLGPPRRVSTTLNSPLFPSLNSVQDVLYSYIEEEDLENFEPDTARSQSPGPFSPEDSEGAPECMISSSLADNPGKRRALIIALEYRGPGQKWNDYASTPLNMQGPYSDGDDVYHLLLQQGYQEDEITYMTDKPNTPALLQPTCMNIKYQLARLVADANPGDRFFLYYAGHGIQVEDTNGDEFDGWDEAIIPTDWATTYNYRDEGLIIDDYLKEACVNTLPKGAHLTAVFDCCHAGTIMDLPYEHSTKENGLKFKSNKLTGLFSRRLPSRHGSVDGRVLCISACEDSQRAYARTRGLLTEAFTRCIRRSAKVYSLAHTTFRLNPTLKQLYEYILCHGRPDPRRDGSRYTQDPMLATTYKLSAAEYHRPFLI